MTGYWSLDTRVKTPTCCIVIEYLLAKDQQPVSNYFDLEPYQTIYIGDSQVDELAARAAAIPLVAFRNRELSADYYIDTLKELEVLLDL